MATYVRVDQDLYGRQGLKVVITEDGQTLELLPGELAEPGADVVVHVGEPRFQLRMAEPVQSDADVPDELGLALRRVAQRLFDVMPDGTQAPGESGVVEWVLGPSVHDGGLLISLDTDGFGFNAATIETMTKIFVDELEPLAIPVELLAASNIPDEILPAWCSSAERLEG